MKRLLILFTAVAALFAAGCEVENTNRVDNVATDEMSEVCIIAEADSDDTRVSLNGNTTCWEVGDRITVPLVVNYYSIVYAEFSIKSSSDISADGKRARFYGEVCDSCVRFSPVLYGPEQMAGMHGLNENIEVNCLPPAVDYYKAIIRAQENR
jgi:acetylornithine deacetylase/succinyl-diaminopimelate desuccinylase-like protein